MRPRRAGTASPSAMSAPAMCELTSAVGGAQRVERAVVVRRCRRRIAARVGPDRGQQLGAHRRRVRQHEAAGVVVIPGTTSGSVSSVGAALPGPSSTTSTRQSSGWRTRWSPSATDVPSTAYTRARSAAIRVERGDERARPARRSRRCARARSGRGRGPARAPRSSTASTPRATRPGSLSRRTARAESAKPSRARRPCRLPDRRLRCPVDRHVSAAACSRTTSAKACANGRQTSHHLRPALAQAGHDRVRLEAAALHRRGVVVGPRLDDVGVDLGVELHRPGALAEAVGLVRAVRRRGQQHGAGGQRRDRVAVVLRDRRRSAAAPRTTGRPPRRAAASSSLTPTSGVGVRSTAPPRASDMSWPPRHTPRTGRPERTPSTRSARVAGSHGATSSSHAAMAPPSTTRPSTSSGSSDGDRLALRRPGSRRARRPSPRHHSPSSAGGSVGSLWTTSSRTGAVAALTAPGGSARARTA